MKKVAFGCSVLLIAFSAFSFGSCTDKAEQSRLKAGESMCFSFEDRQRLLYAEYRDINGKLEIVQSADRKYSRFEIYGNPVKGENCWPAISFYSNTAPALLTDKNFSKYKGLRLDLKNEDDAPCTFNLILFDGDYNRYKDYSIELSEFSDWTTFEVIFDFEETKTDELYKDFDPTNVLMIEFWVENPLLKDNPYKLCLDDLRYFK